MPAFLPAATRKEVIRVKVVVVPDAAARGGAPENLQGRLLTVREVAEALAVHEFTVRAWIRSGRLKALKVGPRAVRVPASAVEEIVRPAR